MDSQSAVREELDAEKGEKQYTADDMLVEYDPFGTNTQSLYVYFQTETPVSVSCTVHVEDEDIPDYTQQLTEDGSYLLEHEYQVIGLVPDMENEITFTLAETDGQTEEQTITYEMGSLLGQEAVQLETEEGDSGEDVIVRLDVSDGTPSVDYMISDPAVWSDTEWAGLVLEKDGDFASQGGQHSITYVEDESLPEGQYYLYMFNNNIGVSETRPDFD